MDYSNKSVKQLHDIQWMLIAAAEAAGVSSSDIPEVHRIDLELRKRRLKAGLQKR